MLAVDLFILNILSNIKRPIQNSNTQNILNMNVVPKILIILVVSICSFDNCQNINIIPTIADTIYPTTKTSLFLSILLIRRCQDKNIVNIIVNDSRKCKLIDIEAPFSMNKENKLKTNEIKIILMISFLIFIYLKTVIVVVINKILEKNA